MNTNHNSSELNRLQIESDFHDQWALQTKIEDVLVNEAFEAPTALENQFILSSMGDLRGKRILDVGCGLGESAVYFAMQGAEVTCTDLSEKMIEFAHSLAVKHGVKIVGFSGPIESIDLPKQHFDFIFASNVIHHVDDKRRFFQVVASALKRDGAFYSWDPLAYNPLIWVYRWLAHEVRTSTESALLRKDLELSRHYFQNVQVKFFWLLTLVIFLKYFLWNRWNPSRVRYWKIVLKENSSSLWWWIPLSKLDRVLTQLPVIKFLCWTAVLHAQSPTEFEEKV